MQDLASAVRALPSIMKEIPENDFFLTPSCILGSVYPASEVLVGRVCDSLGLRWAAAGKRPESQCTCCSGFASHSDLISMESTMLVVARIWSVAAELGFENIVTACVTSFAIHSECLEMLHHEPGLAERIDGWLQRACGRRLTIPKRVVHGSDIVYRYRQQIADKLRHRLVERATGRPLRVADHIGCHYSKVFPEKSVGGMEWCEVLTGPIRAWGGQTVDYPERLHCCGMGFRQCAVQPNRGYTMACILKKLRSMAPWEPDLILTNCPGCNLTFDKEQWAVEQMTGEEYGIPTLSYSELAGLLLGLDPYDVVGIQFHSTPIEPLLDKIGIPYDKSREWSARAKERKEVLA